MAKDNIKVQDTMEVFLVDENDRHYFFGCTEEASITKSVESELLTCGIGNTQSGKLWTGQSYSLTVQPLYYSENLLAMQVGNQYTTGTFQNFERETKVAEDDGSGGAQITLDGTPLNDEVWVVNGNNEQFSGTFATGIVSITDGEIGDKYTVIYKEEQASADLLDLDATKFPKHKHVQLHTIAYNVETDEVVADIYWDFPKCSPDGALDLAYTKGTNTQTPVTFDILNQLGLDSYGTYAIVPTV